MNKKLIDEMEIYCGDIRDPFGVKEAMKGCDAVIHLAALIAIPYSYKSPATYIDTNINGTLNILQAAKDLVLSKVIHTSTSEVYGSAIKVPITEDHPLQGQSPYSATKIGADQMALAFHRSFDTPVTIVRPFNTYGPRQSARAVIPTVISQIASKQKKIELGALFPTRDFTYVSDTVNGFISTLETNDIQGETMNLGNNFEISIGELVKKIIRLMGADIKIITDPKRLRPDKSEVDRLLSDNSKAKSLTGWNPAFADEKGLERGLKKTIDWFTNPRNLAMYKSDIYNV